MKYTLEEKKKIVQNYQNYDGSLLEYCNSNNLGVSTYYKWKSELLHNDSNLFVDITKKIEQDKTNSSITLNINKICSYG